MVGLRTQTELLSDLSRLEGERFDETVFELFHRGPKSIDKLRSFVESACPDMKTKVEASIARQWTRVQEVLANLDPTALGSPGAKYALRLGPADAIARRALRSIDRGEYETAACLAAALPEDSAGRYDGAELESLLAMAAGRPERALELLRPYLAPGAHVGRAAPVYARAAMAAGKFSKACAELPGAALAAMIGSADAVGLGECIYSAAVAGRPDVWERMAQGICEAIALLVTECERAVRDCADPSGSVAQAIEAVCYAAADLAEASSDGLARSLRLELVAAGEELTREAQRAVEALSLLTGAGRDELAAMAGSALAAEGFGAEQVGDACQPVARWFRAVQGFSAGAQQNGADIPRQARAAAAIAGLGVTAFWAGGRRIIELTAPQVSAPVRASGRIIDFDSTDCVSLTLAALRGSLPAQAGESIVAQAIAYIQSKARCSAGEGAKLMREAAASAGSTLGATAHWKAARAWLGLPPYAERAGHNGGDEAGGQSDDEGAEQPDAARLPDADQARRTAYLLVRAAAAGQLPEAQCELIPFLMAKAVMGALERARGDELAMYRLRPALTAMLDQAGKRRREFRQAALARVSEAIGARWDAARTRAGVEKLCAIVLDGANRKLTSDPALAGIALVCSGLASGDGGQVGAGQALARFALALQRVQARSSDGGAQSGGGCNKSSAIWSELEEAANGAFDAVEQGNPV